MHARGGENMGILSKKVNLIESTEVDKIPIRKDSFSRNAYVIELSLDSQPDYVWQVIFEREWKFSLNLWERKVVIVGDKLLLITTPTEIEEKIEWLRNVIEKTNMNVEKFNQTQRTIKEAEKAEALRKHENIIRDALRTKLSLV